MATQPTLNSQAMPYVNEYEEQIFYKGSVRRMANGNLVRDLVTSSAKLRFTMTWRYLTITERGNVETALGYVADGTSRTFVSPRNQSYTAVLAEGGEPTWTVHRVTNGSGTRYSGTLVLEEV